MLTGRNLTMVPPYGFPHGPTTSKTGGVGPPYETDNQSTHHLQCSVELVTCASCVIEVKFKFLNLTETCPGNNLVDNPCRFVFLFILGRNFVPTQTNRLIMT